MFIPNKHCGYLADGTRTPFGGGGGKGGGGSAPPPDPRLVQAQIDSMGFQNKAIQKMMDNSDAMMPTQLEQMKFGLNSAKTAYDQSQQDRTWGLARRGELDTLQAQQLKDAQGFNEGNRANQLVEQAQQDVSNAYGNAQGMTQRAMAARGINAGSGAAMAAMNDNSLSAAMASANAANKTREAARQEGYALTDRAANSRMGFQSQLSGLTGSGASYGASGIGMANSTLSGMNSGYGAASGAAGSMGSNATGMYNAQANFNTKNAEMQNSQSDPFGAILGKGLGAAATAYGSSLFPPAAAAASDRRLKKNIKRIGQLDSGLPVYSFQYKSGGPTVIGVMADEVEKVIPSAVHKKVIDGEFDAVDYAALN